MCARRLPPPDRRLPRQRELATPVVVARVSASTTKAIPLMTNSSSHIRLAVALDGAGWHPAAWREADARPDELFDAGYWADLVAESERGLLDFVTIEDSLTLQSDHPFEPDERIDRVRGRLDALLIAARVAPLTQRIGLIPTVTVTHTEPFHVSKSVATLDYISTGRAGVRVAISPRPDAAAHFGRRALPHLSADPNNDPAAQQQVSEYFAEAADYVEVLRRLWDSWEDDAEIRDVATGRFVDRRKLHYIDFEGRWFSVKGPSITPRPPQGQPIVAALGHGGVSYQLIAESADVGFATPHDATQAADIVVEIGALRRAVGRTPDTLHIFADLVVFLDRTPQAAQTRKDRLDDLIGAEYRSDAEVFVGTPAQLADLLQEWHASGLSGFRLRPATLPHDLVQITESLVPDLRRRGLFRSAYETDTLRGLLGLGHPANRYATA
jgi:alkanesulfonate monooxygenase SsuD/methylene tetrahydromethanopterin reductase-like flavin-dependent oxidoreductase (luciferase family)